MTLPRRLAELCIQERGRLRCVQCELTDEEFEDLVMETAALLYHGERTSERAKRLAGKKSRAAGKGLRTLRD